MKFGLFYENSVPRSVDARVRANRLQQRAGSGPPGRRARLRSCVWAVEHHFLEEYSHQLCEPVGEFVNDQVSTVNFLYCHEDDGIGRATGRRMADTFNYLASQLISAREAYPTRSYPSLGLLPQLRRQATGPEASEQAGEGLALGGPERIMRAPKKWEAVGVDRVNFLLNCQEVIPQADVLASLRLFAREVMPAFADHKAAKTAGA
jgi:hypothetical protein